MTRAAAFLDALPPDVRPLVDEVVDLEAVLGGLCDAGRAAWPAVRLDELVYSRHVAGVVAREADPAGALGALLGGDLWLACACTVNAPGAIAEFERHFSPVIAAALRTIDSSPSSVDEARQILRERLLCASDDGPPRLSTYGGRGPLAAWLRVTAIRTGLNLRRAASPERAATTPDDEAVQLADQAPDPELAFLKGRYRAEFRAAFSEALRLLEPRPRGVLRLYYLDGVKLEQIAALHQVNVSSVSRWMAGARQALLDGTRRILGERLGLRDEEIDSLLQLAATHLSVSLSAVLGRERDP